MLPTDKRAQGLCCLKANICCFWGFTETTNTVVFLRRNTTTQPHNDDIIAHELPQLRLFQVQSDYLWQDTASHHWTQTCLKTNSGCPWPFHPQYEVSFSIKSGCDCSLELHAKTVFQPHFYQLHEKYFQKWDQLCLFSTERKSNTIALFILRPLFDLVSHVAMSRPLKMQWKLPLCFFGHFLCLGDLFHSV